MGRDNQNDADRNDGDEEPSAEDARAEALAAMLEGVTPEQLVAEVMGVGERAKALKVAFVALKRAKNFQEMDRLSQRALAVDIPNLITDLASKVAGSIVALDYFIQSGPTEYEEDEDEDEYNDDEDGQEEPEASAAEIRATLEAVKLRAANLRMLVDYIDLQTGVPDPIRKAVAGFRADIEGFDASAADMESYLAVLGGNVSTEETSEAKLPEAGVDPEPEIAAQAEAPTETASEAPAASTSEATASLPE